MPDQSVAEILDALVEKLKAAEPPPPVVLPPPPPPPRTPVQHLLDQFVESLRPAHDKWAAVPFSEITMTKQGLWEAAQALLIQYDQLKEAEHA